MKYEVFVKYNGEMVGEVEAETEEEVVAAICYDNENVYLEDVWNKFEDILSEIYIFSEDGSMKRIK